MPTPARVFFSYSLSRSTDAAATRRAIDTTKRLVAGAGMAVVDALDPDIGSVRDKVQRAVLGADAAVVDASTSVPNVMFELGMAHGLSYPVVMLLNPAAYESPEFKDYFDVIGHGPALPFGADAGDLEYLVYPGAGEPEAETRWRAFEERSCDVVAKLREILTPEGRALRRGAKEIFTRSHEFARSHHPSHPILGFLGGRLGGFAGLFDGGGPTVFSTPATYYRQCFEAFAEAEPDKASQVRAIADLNTPIETFWDDHADPLRAVIKERLFLLTPAHFFDGERLREISKTMGEQAGRHAVTAGRAGAVPPPPHPLGEDALGCHLLLMAPDLVGGYVHGGPGRRTTLLHVERHAGKYREAVAYFERLRQGTFPIDHRAASPDDVRRAWIGSERVGRWEKGWTVSVQRCPPDYFARYDLHIRAWIPDYDALVARTKDVAAHAVSQRSREVGGELGVLEIGFGTGALTRPLADWIERLNFPQQSLDLPPTVGRYYGVDASPAMHLRATEWARSAGLRTPVLLFEGVAPGALPPAFEGVTFDLICGSLVLHDLLTVPDDAAREEVLRQLAGLVRPGGRLVFGDIFPRDAALDAAGRGAQLRAWRAWMQDFGLSETEIDDFLAANADMTTAISVQQLEALCARVGLALQRTWPVRGAPDWSPFQVVALKRVS